MQEDMHVDTCTILPMVSLHSSDKDMYECSSKDKEDCEQVNVDVKDVHFKFFRNSVQQFFKLCFKCVLGLKYTQYVFWWKIVNVGYFCLQKKELSIPSIYFTAA